MQPVVVPLAAPAASGQVVNIAGRITWFSLRESGGANPAVVRLYDGSGTSGKLMASISLQAAESTREWVGNHGLPFNGGLYLQVVSGAVEGSIVYVPESAWWESAMPVVIVGDLALLGA